MELLTVNNVWMMICTALVFFMHLGFSFLEIGLTRQKNTINILFKNFFVITAGLIIYCLIGFNLMYPGDWIIEGVLGTIVPGLDSVAASDLSYNEGYTYWTDFLFQGMFAATAATIISGAVAERIKINSFILIAIAAEIVLRHTNFGRKVYLVGANKAAGKATGHENFSMAIIVFTICSVCCAFVAVAFVAQMDSAQSNYFSAEFGSSGDMTILVIATVMVG